MILNAARHRYPVFDMEGSRIINDVGFHEAKRMVDLNQARVVRAGQCLQLTGIGEPHPCRTHTSRGGLLAALGMSQCYTQTNNIRRVNGFKDIFPEDWSYFNQATLTNLKLILFCVAMAGI